MVKITGLCIVLITLAGCATVGPGPGYVAPAYPAATVTTYPAPVPTYRPATVRTTSYNYPDYSYPYSTTYSTVGYYPGDDVYYTPSSYYLGY